VEGLKRGVPAWPVRVLGAKVLKGRACRRGRTEEWSDSAKAAAEGVLTEFMSKTA